MLLVPQNWSLEEVFRPDPSWVLWILCLESMPSTAIGTFLNLQSEWKETKGNSDSQCFGNLLGKPNQHLKRMLLIPGVGVIIT